LSAYYLGIDIGSASAKAVIFDGRNIVASSIMPSGTNYPATALALKTDVLTAAGLKQEEIISSASTGSGGRKAGANKYYGVIVCDARGIHFSYPSARTIIDIGWRGSQVITIDADGLVINFNNSETCATGSARLIQVIAWILRMKVDELGPLSLKSTNPSNFSTSCSIFIETEVITRISQGDKPEDIMAGIHRSIADKIGSLSRGGTLEPDILIIGGGALDIGLVKAIEDNLQLKVVVPDNPRLIAALGAAVIASESV
jgi:(R)-2-hydroxyacyl-CoA dehydratese activating ATPase